MDLQQKLHISATMGIPFTFKGVQYKNHIIKATGEIKVLANPVTDLPKPLTSVEVLDGTTDIDGFSGMRNLEEVVLPTTVEHIHVMAFLDCGHLKKINFPKGVRIGQSALHGTGLTDVTLKNAILGVYAFEWCRHLKRANLIHCVGDEGTESESAHCLCNIFLNCRQLEEVCIVGDINAYVGTFENCTSLTSVTLPKRVCEIDRRTFLNCKKLPYIDISPKSVGTESFKDCVNLKSIDLSKCSVVGLHAFENCKSLRKIDLCNARQVSEFAFSCCTSLTDIVYPCSPRYLSYIDDTAFTRNTNVQRVYVPQALNGSACVRMLQQFAPLDVTYIVPSEEVITPEMEKARKQIEIHPLWETEFQDI